LETLNALTDSNRLLREERAQLSQRHDQMAAKVAALELELEPLRSADQTVRARVDELSVENQTLRKQVRSGLHRFFSFFHVPSKAE